MLEYGKLTQLDNDYMTLMSDYLLYNDLSRILQGLTHLAELGQINAIQTYYVLYGKPNEKIEKHIQKIIEDKPSNYNEALALSRYYLRVMSKEETAEVESLISLYKSLENDLFIHAGRGGVLKNTNVEKDMNKTLDDILSYDALKYEVMAIDILEGLPYINEKMLQVKYELKRQSTIHKLIGDRVKNGQIKKIRKVFYAKLKECPNDVTTKYYLAKNIARIEGNKKEIKLGRKILEELSSRPLSVNKETMVINHSSLVYKD